ncbi:glycoside hydrolase family 2 TIM barrel-domain containing protein [Dongshaea marina]|uniref:glycoside hydrolase family 2 TIM barrel-domain containing protein n=1 Tax=Dongshaea marina TaxID=2047966 RepID=UPI000D3E3509|nr:glycoside hydrolase family 2 TIM barrel-domain containing protein [Dongshaea marina]
MRYATKKITLATAVLTLLSSGIAQAASSAPYSDVTIPKIDAIVSNFSIQVQLPSSWKLDQKQNPITYTLQGEKNGSWSNIFGTGAQANTQITLPVVGGSASPKSVHVVVPKFSTAGYSDYRLLFMVKVSTDHHYQMLGTIPLQSGQVSNNGSVAGNIYTLEWQNGAPQQLNPTGGINALTTSTHPPKIAVDPQTKHKILMVWSETKGDYEPFFIRGMDYEPTPVGQLNESGSPITAPGESVHLADFNQTGGGQICSSLVGGPFGTPNKSYCFDSDMTGPMHQYLNNTSLAGAAEHNALLKQRWERDFKMMKAMGVNTIRIYHIDPLVRNMTDFLNLAHSYGIYTIMPAPAPNPSQTFEGSPLTGHLLSWEQMREPNSGQPWSALMQLELAKYAANSDILAWTVGNETEADEPTNPVAKSAAKVEWTLAKTIKQFDPNLLVTSTNQDHYNSVDNFKSYYDVFKKEGVEAILIFTL